MPPRRNKKLKIKFDSEEDDYDDDEAEEAEEGEEGEKDKKKNPEPIVLQPVAWDQIEIDCTATSSECYLCAISFGTGAPKDKCTIKLTSEYEKNKDNMSEIELAKHLFLVLTDEATEPAMKAGVVIDIPFSPPSDILIHLEHHMVDLGRSNARTLHTYTCIEKILKNNMVQKNNGVEVINHAVLTSFYSHTKNKIELTRIMKK
jgi:hypothetical protein